jgi:selenocysteine-specific elongation factor
VPGEQQVAHGVVATAGHVDHGKSSLIVRLTGIDPDRWDEEKRRGLTIDLGYAWCELPSGREVGFVDVPGHERFIRNMLAGVGPAPLVLFVVAADEGWKPQSEEHLEILDVLGVGSGVIALTKCDLVDDETIGFAEQEILERLEGTTLEGAPIVRLSSVTGAGIDDLRAALDAMLERAQVPSQSPPRLFVDRVFTIREPGPSRPARSRAGASASATRSRSSPAIDERGSARCRPTGEGRIARVRSPASRSTSWASSGTTSAEAM